MLGLSNSLFLRKAGSKLALKTGATRNLPRSCVTFDIRDNAFETSLRLFQGSVAVVYLRKHPPILKMITRFLTEVSTVFNPFSPKAKTARLFLSFLPPNARQSMKIDTRLLPRTSRDKSFVAVKFKDGKEMKLDAEKLGIKGVVEEVDRHSRILSRQEELNGN